MKKALIVQGGWQGHEPLQVAEIFKSVLEKESVEVEISDSLDSFLDVEKLKNLDLIVPAWTMGEISNEQVMPVLEAVDSGVGIAGCHGGMCDSFRWCTEWQFMTGAQWVAHPGNDGIEYEVNIKNNELLKGINDFTVKSEQYYIHVDPAVKVLATTKFPVAEGSHSTNGEVEIPVVFTKYWGKGKVFYSSLGHVANVFDTYEALEIMRRGFLWALK